MSQTEQMREALREFLVREMPAGTVIGDPEWWVPKIMKALAAEPAPLVRLTEDEITEAYNKADAYLMLCDEYEFGLVARAIQNAMEEKNK